MVVKLQAELKQNALDLVRAGKVFRRGLRDFLPILWSNVDRDITDHIHQRFEGKNDWEDLRPITMDLRVLGLSGRAPRQRSSRGRKLRPTLYYDRFRPSVRAPLSPRAFGWTTVTQRDVAELPGKAGVFQLTREFAKGTKKGDVLRYWHFGTRTRVTPKVRAWLHHHGVHLSPRTTELVRPARPVYDPKAVDTIVQRRGAQWLNRFVALLDPNERGLRFVVVNGRPGGL